MTDLPKQLSDLSPADYNPRTITDAARKGLQKSLTEFGDLSGVVYNSRTGNLVAAHQRREALLESDFDVSAIRWGKPFEGVKGEEREGWFQFGNGARFRVRLVDWPETFEKAANVSANNPNVSGSFTDGLAGILGDLEAEFPAFDELLLGELLTSDGAPDRAPAGASEIRTGRLRELYVEPPFSVLDARQGTWRQRKSDWKDLGIRSEVGRVDGLAYGTALAQRRSIYAGKDPSSEMSGTSIFDPVLCELMYRWFCPPGGSVLDPFAGGTVRGVVAAFLGLQYTGVDLRQEQIDANVKQWEEIRPDATPELSRLGNLRVVSHAGQVGGTKRVVISRLMADRWSEDTFVYATPAFGFAQIALAAACKEHGRRCVLFVAKRKELHRYTRAAVSLGAEVHEVKQGYLSNVQAKARVFCEDTNGARLLPFGFYCSEFVSELADLARQSVSEQPVNVWCVAGSGVLTRALQTAWPDAAHHAVRIGKADCDVGCATAYTAEEKYEDAAKLPPPFPSHPNYDAKAWQFLRDHADGKGTLFWNVAGDLEVEGELHDPMWHQGDSQDLSQLGDNQYDFVLTCPPYADLEVYSDDPSDLSSMDWEGFQVAYRKIIAEAAARLRPNRFMVVVVGEARGKDHMYYGLVPETIEAARLAGLGLYNEAILVTPVGTLPIRAGNFFSQSRKMGKSHQNVLIFCKGSPQLATAACGRAYGADVTALDPDTEETI